MLYSVIQRSQSEQSSITLEDFAFIVVFYGSHFELLKIAKFQLLHSHETARMARNTLNAFFSKGHRGSSNFFVAPNSPIKIAPNM